MLKMTLKRFLIEAIAAVVAGSVSAVVATVLFVHFDVFNVLFVR